MSDYDFWIYYWRRHWGFNLLMLSLCMAIGYAIHLTSEPVIAKDGTKVELRSARETKNSPEDR